MYARSVVTLHRVYVRKPNKKMMFGALHKSFCDLFFFFNAMNVSLKKGNHTSQIKNLKVGQQTLPLRYCRLLGLRHECLRDDIGLFLEVPHNQDVPVVWY